LVCEAERLADTLGKWSDQFQDALVVSMLARLGVAPAEKDRDRELVSALIRALQTRATTIDRLFFDWRGGRDPGGDTYAGEPFRALASALEGRAQPPSHPYWSDPEPCSMHIDEVESLWAPIADADDWGPLEAKIAAVRRMGEAMVQDAPASA
jgi:hypothetical protein